MAYDQEKLKKLVEENKTLGWAVMARLANSQGLTSRTGKPFNQGSLWSEAERNRWITSTKTRSPRNSVKKEVGNGHASLSYADLEEIMTSNLKPSLKVRIVKSLAAQE